MLQPLPWCAQLASQVVLLPTGDNPALRVDKVSLKSFFVVLVFASAGTAACRRLVQVNRQASEATKTASSFLC